MSLRSVSVRGVKIGGGAPVSIQSMTNTDTRDAQKTLKQITALAGAGCDIVRLAIPDRQAAEALREIRALTDIPLVADIHFDHKLALAAIDAGADKIRINPGNMPSGLADVAAACRERGIPIRVGLNAGSFDGDITDAALREADRLEKLGFFDIVLSVKTSDVRQTVAAARRAAEYGYPLHIGVTESGTRAAGIVKSAVGIGALLLDGIGDTIRVSLTADPVEEVIAAKRILSAAGLRESGADIISCPTCGRCRVDIQPIAEELERRLSNYAGKITVAVMGCAVNGPGEARHADIGIAGGDGEFLLFEKGEIAGKFPQEDALGALLSRIGAL